MIIIALAVIFVVFLIVYRIVLNFKQKKDAERQRGTSTQILSHGLSRNHTAPSSSAVQATQQARISEIIEPRISPHPLPQSAPPVAPNTREVHLQSGRGLQQLTEEERRQMADELIRLLPTFLSGPSLAADHCPVCLEPCARSPITMGTCMHPVHTACLTSWIVKSTLVTCPLCRTSLLATTSL